MPHWFRREIHPGMTGSDVDAARRLLRLPSGPWDTEAALRMNGRCKGSGAILTASVAEVLGETVLAGLTPSWWHRGLSRGMSGPDVLALRARLDLEPGGYDLELEDEVRRWQSAHDITPTGVVDEELARLLGE